MTHSHLPSRPNLEHLRRQAKALLAALHAGEADAAAVFREHLPAAKAMTAAKVRGAGFRLADAQAAIARKTGFASWPRLARHVEQLRALEGTWEIATLEMDGAAMPAAMVATSRVLIDGDRFRTETPGVVYEGIFTIDVEAEPHTIDIDFVEGPEAGNRNLGVYSLDGDTMRLCLDMTGAARPKAFRTSPGSGHAFETLRRASASRPAAVATAAPATSSTTPEALAAGFAPMDCQTLARLQGEWTAVSVQSDGQTLPAHMLASGRRTAVGNEVRVSFGGQVMIHALVRFNTAHDPAHIDYFLLAGPHKGAVQHGVLRWDGDEPTFCMAAPGKPRPTAFDSKRGGGQTLSRWRKA